jgi:lipopolysaccharide transport system permease protein
MVLFPLIHAIYFWMVLGVGMFLGSLYVYFRDINQIWEVVANILFFLCPIIYPMAAITERTMPFYLLNPLTDAIIIYRDIMIYGKLPDPYNVGILLIFSIGAFLVGYFVFEKLQRRFAEVI